MRRTRAAVKIAAVLVVGVVLLQVLPVGAGAADRPSPGVTASRAEAVEKPARSVGSASTAKAGDWDPRDPAAVQYADGAWGVSYTDGKNPSKLFFRRTVGGQEPAYWRDATTIDSGADAPAAMRLGSTTAVFYRKTVAGVGQVLMRTSGDDGTTWSAPTQLTTGTVSVYQIQASVTGGTAYLFWSSSDTSGRLQYRTSINCRPGPWPLKSGKQSVRSRASPTPTSTSSGSVPRHGPSPGSVHRQSGRT